MRSLPAWLWVALFGALGTLLRYAVALVLPRAHGAGFPWSTFAVNVAGCVAIGGLAAVFERSAVSSPAMRTALLVGLLGGFTTFSSVALDALRMVHAGSWGAVAAYVVATNVTGIAGAWISYRLCGVLLQS